MGKSHIKSKAYNKFAAFQFAKLVVRLLVRHIYDKSKRWSLGLIYYTFSGAVPRTLSSLGSCTSADRRQRL